MTVSEVIAFCAALVSGSLALGVAFSAKSLARWFFVAGMALLSAESLLIGLSWDAVLPQEIAHWQQWRLVLLSLIPGSWFLFSITYAREDARASMSRKPWLWGSVLIIPAGLALACRGRLISAVGQTDASDPTSVALSGFGILLELWVLVAGILVLMNLERTFRASVGTMRWRIKFMVIGLGALFVIRSYTASQALLFKSISFSLQALNSMTLLLACILLARTLVRTGHFETAIYPSQSLLRGSFTVLLAGTYLVVLGIAANVASRLGGESLFQVKAFLILASLVLLAVILLSDRVRLLSRRFISRQFHRPLHDYRAIWRTFTERTSRCFDPQALCKAIADFVSEEFQALSVDFWVADDTRSTLTLAASTAIVATPKQESAISGEQARDIVRGLSKVSEPIDIDTSKALWLEPLRLHHPPQFTRIKGARICVPLVGGGGVQGCLIIADRVAGISFTLQDLELLKAIGDQSAASLLAIQLLDKLARARQLEAFQAMSAFFVHDLKNTASTLALMLKNFPLHYANPSFREDALRGIGRTVAHLNDLIARLNTLRHDLELTPQECDLNQLVDETLRTQCDGDAVLVKEFNSIPRVNIDPAQIAKVLTNLVLNAREAVQSNGRIEVGTSRRNDWVVLGVSDNGCGMSPDFISHSLFRPFKSTKKTGLGIGMFHCKLIIEAHRGQIEVESEPGKGTQFRVLLPIST